MQIDKNEYSEYNDYNNKKENQNYNILPNWGRRGGSEWKVK